MYEYSHKGSTWDGSAAVYARVFRSLGELAPGSRILDAGCGNGHLSALLYERGFECIGIDGSESGIEQARRTCPSARFACLDLTAGLGDLTPGSFDAVTCIEVLEHVYSPRLLLSNLLLLLKPGGRLILTTPYHGYVKNAAILLSGRFDRHFNPLWDHGHIKFFSRRTLTTALDETGYRKIEVAGIGRVATLWKTMLATAMRPAL